MKERFNKFMNTLEGKCDLYLDTLPTYMDGEAIDNWRGDTRYEDTLVEFKQSRIKDYTTFLEIKFEREFSEYREESCDELMPDDGF
jgi:hypothetical protein